MRTTYEVWMMGSPETERYAEVERALALSTEDGDAARRLNDLLADRGYDCELVATVDPASINANDVVADIMGCSAGDLELCDVPGAEPGRRWTHCVRHKQSDASERLRPPLAFMAWEVDPPGGIRGPGDGLYRWVLTPDGVEYAAENINYPLAVVNALRERAGRPAPAPAPAPRQAWSSRSAFLELWGGWMPKVAASAGVQSYFEGHLRQAYEAGRREAAAPAAGGGR
jgi:hypothetical protein